MVKMHLKAARVNADLTQSQVCEKLNIAKSTLVSWEQEKTFPRAEQLQNLCNLYHCEWNDIFIPETLTLK